MAADREQLPRLDERALASALRRIDTGDWPNGDYERLAADLRLTLSASAWVLVSVAEIEDAQAEVERLDDAEQKLREALGRITHWFMEPDSEFVWPWRPDITAQMALDGCSPKEAMERLRHRFPDNRQERDHVPS